MSHPRPGKGSMRDSQAVAIGFSPNGPPIEPQVLETPKICLPLPFFRSGRSALVTFMTPNKFVLRLSMTSCGVLQIFESLSSVAVASRDAPG